MNIDIAEANRQAVSRMTEARPLLRGVARAAEVIPGMHPRKLLHAGPPIEWKNMSGPLRGAVVGALIFEGLAADQAGAVSLVNRGEIDFAPCHQHQAVGPMAGVISSSMAVYVVENAVHGNRAFSNFNEGYGKVLRYGANSPEVLEKLRWINGEMADLIGEALAAGEPIDMRVLLAEALHMGDEGHNRNKAGSLIFLRLLAPRVAMVAKSVESARRVIDFLGDNALSVLNPVMAACKAMADAAAGIEGCTLVSAMARNGTEFGIRVSGLGEQWFTAPCRTPKGLYFTGFSAEDANPDIGDSTITETAGIGAFAMAAAPAIVRFIGGSPRDAHNATLEMYEITVAEHPHFTIPSLDFRGTPVGIDIRKVVELGILPRVNTGIAHREPGIGQIGAGLVLPPMEIFQQALLAFADKFGF